MVWCASQMLLRQTTHFCTCCVVFCCVRVSEAEKELSRLTADVVTLNGQLMDTIRKKVMISQELDQWQVRYGVTQMTSLVLYANL